MKSKSKNESWTEFMNRVKSNGVSPTMQETIDRDNQKEIYEIPEVVNFAYNIIDLYNQNKQLKDELAHCKQLLEIQQKSLNDSEDNIKEVIRRIYFK